MAFLLALGYHTFLRTGEILNLRIRDISLKAGQPGAVSITRSKTGLRFNIDEAVAIYDVELYRLWELCHLPFPRAQDQLIWNKSSSSFRNLFYKGVRHLQLDGLGYQPYSIRRGGATHAFVVQQTLDTILLRGRWRSLAVARLYLEDGQSQLAQLRTSQRSKKLIAKYMAGIPHRLLP